MRGCCEVGVGGETGARARKRKTRLLSPSRGLRAQDVGPILIVPREHTESTDDDKLKSKQVLKDRAYDRADVDPSFKGPDPLQWYGGAGE